MPAFTAKDALAIIDAEIARLEARWPDATTFASGNEIHAARMALLNAKNAILVGQIEQATEIESKGWPTDAPHSRACGITLHSHGPACHSNCVTCHGKAK